MSDNRVTSLADKLQNLELGLKSHHRQEVGYGRSLREAILSMDVFMEVEVLKSLGDLHLQKGKLNKDSAEIDKAAALYAAALLRCTDPDMGQTIEHRIGYMEKLSRQLLQGYTPHFQWLSLEYWGTADSNIVRVVETCDKLDRKVSEPWHSVEEAYTETLVTAIENCDIFLELEVLKSLGDFYLENGKKTVDVSQFSKAAAMYKKALTRCEDPETKPTLHHRISYAEKIIEAVIMQPTSDKQMQIRRRLSMGLLTQYKDHMRKGESSLDRADLASAEQHFAAALKTVHKQDPTAQQYQREVEPLCKLGDVYSNRGQQTGDGGDFVKAAALYNAAIARSEDQVLNGNIDKAIEEVNKSFLKCILDIHCEVGQENTSKHEKYLQEMRDQIKLEMETIDQQLDPYIHDEDDSCLKEIEAKRAQAVRKLFEEITQQRKEFISLLVEECTGLMGSPPCKYALIGLGSQATGLVTPYSDLEFAILVEEESEECLVYFRNLTHYLHLKVVNLGETILPALGIKSLNDFYSEDPLDNWYYDSVTPRGFAFDGFMPKASKTPLGRQGTVNEQSSELICTPSNMASILQKDVTLYLKDGYHLATILRNPCLIAGDQDLVDTYMAITEKILQADEGKISQQLAQETQMENIRNSMYNDAETITAKLIDVKKNVYRFPALAVDCLALSSHIKPTTVWKMIEEMENQQVISTTNAHHLTVLTSISAELRLRTYIANGGQRENLSALASMETILHQQESLRINEEAPANVLKPVFHLPNEKQLFRYYYTAVPLKSAMSKWSGKNQDLQSFSDFYDDSPIVQGHMYFELCKYKLASSYLHEALKTPEQTEPERIILLSNIGHAGLLRGDHQKALSTLEQALKMHGKFSEQCTADSDIKSLGILLRIMLGSVWSGLGDQNKAISYCEQALEMCKVVDGPDTANPWIVASLNNLGLAWHHEADYRKAISYFEQALQVNRRIYGEITVDTIIAGILNNLGSAWEYLSNYSKSVSYYEQALQMSKSIYGHSTAHPHIAALLNNLGSTWGKQGDYRKAITYHEQTLQVYRSIFGQTTAHPDIAGTLDNLGAAWGHLGEHWKAVSYREQALEMRRSVYGQDTAHPYVASSLNNVGSALKHLGDVRSAISYHEQALEMSRKVFGLTKAHPQVATLLNNLGEDWRLLGEHKKEVSYSEQALQMFRNIYGQRKAHPQIAVSLNNLGLAWGNLGDHKREVSYYEQALQMYRRIYGQTTAHPQIASSTDNLGRAWGNLGEHWKAISYHEQALQMHRSIYGLQTTHPEIATSLSNIGSAWRCLRDYRKAISYHEQALEMSRKVFGQTKAHSQVATLLNNLGEAWGELGEHRRSISYYEQALQMFRNIYGQSTTHPQIAILLNNLGFAWGNLGEHRTEVIYHEQALQMYRSVHGLKTAHPEIVNSLNNLGTAWYHLQDYRKSISYHEQAVQMGRTIYGQHIAHPDIATSFHNLGAACLSQGEHRRAVSYLEQALQMRRSIYGQQTAHPDIASSLNNLGAAWKREGNYRKAISYYEQALQMFRSVHDQTTEHLHTIATILDNLGSLCGSLGEHRKGVSYNEQALQMYRNIYGQQMAHPIIAKSLNNLGTELYNLGDFRAAKGALEEALAMAKQIYPEDNDHPLIKAFEGNFAHISEVSVDDI